MPPWHVAFSDEQLLEVARASGCSVAYGDAIEVECIGDDERGQFLCCAWPSGLRGASHQIENVDLHFRLRSSVACDEERSSVEEALFVDTFQRHLRIRAPTAWPSPPAAAHAIWVCLGGNGSAMKLSPQMKLRLRTALGGQLVCAGGSFDLGHAACRAGQRHPRVKVVRVLGSGGAALPVARVSVRTELQVVDDPHARPSVGVGARPEAAATLHPDERAIFPAQRRAYDALCALLRASTPPHSDFLQEWSVRPPSGLLLSGPPGTGKTHVVRAVATRFDVPLVAFSGGADGGTVVDTVRDVDVETSTEPHPSDSSPEGEVGARLQAAFELADRLARRVGASRGRPCSAILFLDEIDAMCPKRSDASTSAELNRCVALALYTVSISLDQLRSRAITPHYLPPGASPSR